MTAAVGIMTKVPRLGHSKTRLARALGVDAALALHQAFLRDEVATLAPDATWDLYLVHDAPRDPGEQALLDGIAGAHTKRLIPGTPDLAHELLEAFRLLLRDHDRVVLVGGDVPHLSRSLVQQAIAALDDADVVIGPGPDGGYYLVGMRAPHDVFTTVTMGGDRAERATVAAARALGLKVAWTAPLVDLDEAQDLLALESLPSSTAPHTRAVVAGLDRSAIALRLPTELQVEVTSRCNLKCETCILTHARPNAPADLTLDDFRRITAGLALGRVAFQLNGEPLLNPDLFAMVALARSGGAYTVVNTNGTLLDERRCEALIASGVDEVRVSVDTVDAAKHRVIVGADILERVLDGVRTLAAARGTTRRPRIGLWMIAMRSTIATLPDLVRTAAAVGADEVYLQRLVLTGHGVAVERESIHGCAAEFEDVFVRAEVIAAEAGIALRAAGRQSLRDSLTTPPGGNPRAGCWRPWRSAVVTSDRRVLPCCISSFTTPYADLSCGDLEREGWETVWNGERYQAVRRGILGGEPARACRGCGERWSL